MNTKQSKIRVGELEVEVVHKDIKNLHVGVYPPFGRVRVAAPLIMSEDAVTLAVVERLGWIKRQKEKFDLQSRESKREMVNGESHYFLGHRYRLQVIPDDLQAAVSVKGTRFLEMTISPKASEDDRTKLLHSWYREQLREAVEPLIEKWYSRLELNGVRWGIRQMRTKWGSCSLDERRIWINLELAKKPLRCLEYVVVHELTHLVVRNHDDQFTKRMDQLLPHWRSIRDELNQSPLSEAGWDHNEQSI